MYQSIGINRVTKALATCIILLCLAACAPTSKESYLEKFDDFISEVSNNYKTYDDKAWEKQIIKYEKFSGRWYDKFKDEFTLNDQISIKANQTKWYFYRNLNNVSSTVKQLLEALDIEGIKNKVQYYIDNNMQSDLQKIYDDAQKAGKDVQEAVSEILKELNVTIEEIQK